MYDLPCNRPYLNMYDLPCTGSWNMYDLPCNRPYLNMYDLPCTGSWNMYDLPCNRPYLNMHDLPCNRPYLNMCDLPCNRPYLTTPMICHVPDQGTCMIYQEMDLAVDERALHHLCVKLKSLNIVGKHNHLVRCKHSSVQACKLVSM